MDGVVFSFELLFSDGDLGEGLDFARLVFLLWTGWAGLRSCTLSLLIGLHRL